MDIENIDEILAAQDAENIADEPVDVPDEDDDGIMEDCDDDDDDDDELSDEGDEPELDDK